MDRIIQLANCEKALMALREELQGVEEQLKQLKDAPAPVEKKSPRIAANTPGIDVRKW